LLISKQGERQIKMTMLLFVFLLIFPSLNAYFSIVSGKPILALQVISQNLTLAYGPILLLIVRQILLKPIILSKACWHFLPFTVLLIDRLSGNSLLHSVGIIFVVFAHVISYLLIVVVMLHKHKNQLFKLIISHKNTCYYWLLFLTFALSTVMLFDLSIWSYSIYFKRIPNLLMLAFIASGMSLYANSIALFALFQPKVFSHELEEETGRKIDGKINGLPEAVNDNSNDPWKDTPQKVRYVELSPEIALQLDDQLTELTRKYKPHLDDSISLAKLSSLLGITRNQLSELLNIHKQVSFYDFLNNLRYQESVNLLKNKQLDLSIIDIAYQAGFNNKNSFYKVFKQKSGLTPTQFKKQGSV
jgi:AraC-like DNA-binding protein